MSCGINKEARLARLKAEEGFDRGILPTQARSFQSQRSEQSSRPDDVAGVAQFCNLHVDKQRAAKRKSNSRPLRSLLRTPISSGNLRGESSPSNALTIENLCWL